MRREFLIVVLSALSGTIVWAQQPIVEPPVIEGTELVASIGNLCPRELPIRVDVNGDGVDDFLYPSYHAGPLKDYMPMEKATAGFGLIGAALAMKARTKNENFAYAGVLDGTTRELLWKFKAGSMINFYEVAPETGRLYVSSHDNHVYALDLASGAVIWSHDVGGNPMGLTLSDDALVVMGTKNAVRAFDPGDGHQVWEKQVKAAIMASPGFGVMLTGGDVVYISSLDDHVFAFDRRSGKTLWSYATQGNPSLRMLTDQYLLVADKKELLALDTSSGKVSWRFDVGGPVHGQPMIDLGETVAFMNGRTGSKARLLAVDLENGQQRWSVPLQKVARDKKRKIQVPQDSNLFKESIQVEWDAEGRATNLFIADRKNVRAIRAADGEETWSRPVQSPQVLYLAGDQILAGDEAQSIHSFATRDGSRHWSTDVDGQIFQMESLGDKLFVTLYSKDLVVLGLEDGKVYGRYHLGEPYRVMPLGEGQLIVCGKSGSWVMAASNASPAR